MKGYAIITDLIGETMCRVENINNEEIIFETVDGDIYRLFHMRDCCEGVTVEDINGDLSDLTDSPITVAEENVHENENPPGMDAKEYQDSFTWTFYRFATAKGHVIIRWYGESNGYYSESVDFEKEERASHED